MYTKEELELIIPQAESLSHALSLMGKSKSGSALNCLKNSIVKYDIDISHFRSYTRIFTGNKKLSHQRILVFDKNLRHRRHANQLRRALIESGRSYKCECCNIDTWCNHKLVLEIDHINGNWKDNRPKNLRFMCPNCHSLTPTFYNKKKIYYCSCGLPKTKMSTECIKCAGKHRRKVINRPCKKELQSLVSKHGYVYVGKMFGVSDNAIRKWLK